MNKDLKKQLQRIANPQRPRPLMFVGWHNGKKCYVRKQSLSYFQLKEKYPPPSYLGKHFVYKHIFTKRHHFKHSLWEMFCEWLGGVL